MKLHNIAFGSKQFHYRKCTICNLTVKPGETIVTEGAHFSTHRPCLKRWLDESYSDQSKDYGMQRETKAQRDARKLEKFEAEFNEYRASLLERLGVDEDE